MTSNVTGWSRFVMLGGPPSPCWVVWAECLGWGCTIPVRHERCCWGLWWNLPYELKCLLCVFNLTKRLCGDLKRYYHGSRYDYSEFSRGPLLLFCPSPWRHLTFPLRAATSIQSKLHKTVIAHHLFYLRHVQHSGFSPNRSSYDIESVVFPLNYIKMLFGLCPGY